MKDWEQIKRELERPFSIHDIKWRVGATAGDKKSGIALAYIDARLVRKRLDDVMGCNWQCNYNETSGKLTICNIGLKIGGEWIWRANGAGDTQVEADKGAASDAFKRAGTMWGVGVYLYGLENIWSPLKASSNGRSYSLVKDPILPAWATPIGYDAIWAKRDAEKKADK